MGPISQLELDELDGATAVGGTTLPDLSCHVGALPRGQPGAGRRQFVPLGPGTTLQVGVPCWQETGCDAARARAVLLIPSRALPDAAPVPSPRPAVGAPGEGAQGGLEGRKVRGGTASAWLVRFPSPELGSAFHVSRFRQMQRRELGLRGCRGSCWQAWTAGEGGRGAASAGRGAPTVQTGWAAAAAPQPAVTSQQHLSLHCWC